MFNVRGMILVTSVSVLLCGCQPLNNELSEINNGLTNLNNSSSASVSSKITSDKKSIKNPWNVSNAQAMNWLSQNSTSWNDHGKLKAVNWYEFWSQQIHANTALAKQAHAYCHQNAWSTQKPGANCATFLQAYSMTKSDESLQLGRAVENAS
jgi:hypothetical protein